MCRQNSKSPMIEAFGKRSFVFGVAVDDYNFTDREQETQQLCKNFEAGINTILVSPRRWGKTSLVKKAAQLVDGERVIMVHMGERAVRDEFDLGSPSNIPRLKNALLERDLIEQGERIVHSGLT